MFIQCTLLCVSNTNSLVISEKSVKILRSSLLIIIVLMAFSRARPNLLMWDWIYEQDKDKWTTPIVSSGLVVKLFVEMVGDRKDLNLLLPLCGRSPDLLWLAEQGHRVTGIEWSERAVKQFFQDSKVTYSTEECCFGEALGSIYRGVEVPVTIYCSNLFSLKGHESIGKFDCIWDHGSVGSFHPDKPQRAAYVAVCDSMLKPGGKILLSTFDYEQSEHPAFPFACSQRDVHEMYGAVEANGYTYAIQTVLQQNKDQCMKIPLFTTGENFQIGKLSRFSWNFYLITKKVVE